VRILQQCVDRYLFVTPRVASTSRPQCCRRSLFFLACPSCSNDGKSQQRCLPLGRGVHAMPSCTYSCERNHRPPAHSLFATLDPLLPVPVMAELLEYCRKETMGEETSFAHSCTAQYSTLETRRGDCANRVRGWSLFWIILSGIRPRDAITS